MKVHAFRVQQTGIRSFGDVVGRIGRLDLPARVFGAAERGFRLEAIREDGDFVYIDFAGPRHGHGPGRISLDAPLSPIEMQPGQNFGEDTGLLYHIPSQYAVLQYNHFGPRMNQIAEYLVAADASFGGNHQPGNVAPLSDRYGFRFGAVLTANAYARFRRMDLVQEFTFSVSIPGALPDDIQAGTSVSAILAAPHPEGLENMTVTMRSGRKKNASLGRAAIERAAEYLMRLGPIVNSTIIRGKDTPESKTEIVDLIEDRLVREFSVQLGFDRRLPQEERWNSLREALVDWLHNGALQQAGQGAP